jgi:hypothetical protein
MIDRIRELARRPVRELPAGIALAVCALVIVVGALMISQLGDTSRNAAAPAMSTTAAMR